MLEEPRCSIRKCKHYGGIAQPDGTEQTERNVCKAFTEKIPDEIAYGKNLHLKPVPGDRGIQYEKEN